MSRERNNKIQWKTSHRIKHSIPTFHPLFIKSLVLFNSRGENKESKFQGRFKYYFLIVMSLNEFSVTNC